VFARRALLILTLSVGACAFEEAAPDGAGTPPDLLPVIETEVAETAVLRASCDDPLLARFPLPDSLAEAMPDFDAELAALDLTSMPEGIDLSTTSHLQRGVLAYMLDLEPAELDRPIPRAQFEARGLMGRAALGAVKRGEAQARQTIDFTFLRRGLHRYYTCESEWPMTIEGFKRAELDFSTLASFEVESRPKRATRKIYNAPDHGIFVAESIADGIVRETEIIIAGRRRARALDFLVYDVDGQLQDRSTFASAGGERVAAAPYACMTCHFDPSTGRFDIIFPD
jgi:hypothetical protein